MRPGVAIVALWLAFVASWVAAAAWSDRTERLAPGREELGSRVVLSIGALLLALPARGDEGFLRLWHPGLAGAWACVAAVAAGIAFSWWARLHLGRLWSARITRKAGHRVVSSGPYGIVRHPIYTGMLLSLYATAAAKGTVAGVAGAALITLGFWLKARLEERWLVQELPPGDYAAYRRRVPMLLPHGPRGS